MATAESRKIAAGSRRLRNYPPFAVVAFALVILLALPSALNLPQSNPTETLEYAPVPPDDNAPPQAGGSLSSLGLGSSSSLEGELPEPGGGAPFGAGAGRTPATKRCVGNPPKQTSDPLSPPCVAHFEGDNGGATYQGVTKQEIRVLIFVLSSSGPNWQGAQQGGAGAYGGQYHDMTWPDSPDMWYQDRYLKAWQRYFNDRYQTYDRFVHFWSYHPGAGGTAETRRAQAADNYAVIKPFAVVFDTRPTNLDAYQEVISRRGVMTFVNTLGLTQGQFQRFPKLSWGFMPSAEEQAKVFGNYLCEKVVPNPVSFSGPAFMGRPRKFGLVYNGGPDGGDFRRMKDAMKTYVSESCGMDFGGRERTYPRDYIAADNQGAQSALEAMQYFEDQGVTTIIWPLGFETNFSTAAKQLGYFPEWIIAGDTTNDGSWTGAYQDQDVWDRHAVVVTPQPREKPINYTPSCEEAYTEADPTIPRDGIDLAQACFFHASLRQLFIGIQVAGPRIAPSTVDRGYRSIPRVASTDPSVPSCYYTPGDSTCVKDAAIMWWDRVGEGGAAGETGGCWRMVQGGQRYLPGGWPAGNVSTPWRPEEDRCNGHVGGQPGRGGF